MTSPTVAPAGTTTATAGGATAARGIVMALLSYACFATADAMIKLSSARFSVFQIGLTLSLFGLLPVLALARGEGGGLRALVPTLPGLVLLRGLLGAACGLVCWQAFATMPLADGYAILFASPLLVTALSVPLLGERVGPHRWAATAVGFVGVLLMIRPDFAAAGAGHALALVAVVLGALSFIVLRKIGARERSAPLMASVFASLALMSAPFAIRDWVAPTGSELLVMALVGLLQGAGQAALVLATRETPAAVVAPFQYSQMAWAVLFGVLLFGDVPQPVLFAGLALVAGSGLYILWREAVRRRPLTLTTGRGEVPARAAR